MDSTRDLLDFFPVHLDIEQLLRFLPPGANFTYRLKQRDSAVNFVYTELKPANVGDYLRKVETSPTYDNARTLGSAVTIQITAEGIPLDVDWLNKISSEGKGIILLEGRAATIRPLTVEVTDASGVVLAQVQLPISIDSVEKMFRHVNFLYVDNVNGGRPTDTSEPANYPDVLTDSYQFIFVHGYNVNPDDARGWNSKMFKSMWWTGSKAKFYGVTWNGADSQHFGVTVNYHINVDHAFGAAHPLANVIETLNQRGDVTVVAHSLGNMIVASAIHDWDAQFKTFCMIDAAVAIEALDGAATQDVNMAHEEWRNGGYDPQHLWASEWYTNPTLATDDARTGLTWRNRLKKVGITERAYNFYSSGEEVLAAPDPDYPVNRGCYRRRTV